MRQLIVGLAVVVMLAGAGQAATIEMVTVGNPGNAAVDVYGYGSVAYEYMIGKYEVTNSQWRELLNAKANLEDPNGLYNAQMSATYGGIDRSGSGTSVDPYVYSAKGDDSAWDNRPVNFVSFWDAARFCNWLHNGQGSGDTESGAYVNVGDQDTFARQSDAKYVIPTEDEWFKAAYHKNNGVAAEYYDYPTSSDNPPGNDPIDPAPGNNANHAGVLGVDYAIGGPYWTTEVGEFENSQSPYGTFDQGGNLYEWNETVFNVTSRGIRGGTWWEIRSELRYSEDGYRSPLSETDGLGFRVASVPEPGSIALLASGLLAGLVWWRRRSGR